MNGVARVSTCRGSNQDDFVSYGSILSHYSSNLQELSGEMLTMNIIIHVIRTYLKGHVMIFDPI